MIRFISCLIVSKRDECQEHSFYERRNGRLVKKMERPGRKWKGCCLKSIQIVHEMWTFSGEKTESIENIATISVFSISSRFGKGTMDMLSFGIFGVKNLCLPSPEDSRFGENESFWLIFSRCRAHRFVLTMEINEMKNSILKFSVSYFEV